MAEEFAAAGPGHVDEPFFVAEEVQGCVYVFFVEDHARLLIDGYYVSDDVPVQRRVLDSLGFMILTLVKISEMLALDFSTKGLLTSCGLSFQNHDAKIMAKMKASVVSSSEVIARCWDALTTLLIRKIRIWATVKRLEGFSK